MPKISDHQEFLSSSMIEDEDLVVILNAGEFKDPSVTGLSRTVFHIDVQLPDGRSKIWSVNKTSQKNLAKFYGDDTTGWVKKQAKIRVVQQNVRGEMKDVLYGYPVEVDVPTQVPLTSETAQTSTPKQPMQRIRFIKFYGAYNVGDEVDIPQTTADGLIENGHAVPVVLTPEEV